MQQENFKSEFSYTNSLLQFHRIYLSNVRTRFFSTFNEHLYLYQKVWKILYLLACEMLLFLALIEDLSVLIRPMGEVDTNIVSPNEFSLISSDLQRSIYHVLDSFDMIK